MAFLPVLLLLLAAPVAHASLDAPLRPGAEREPGAPASLDDMHKAPDLHTMEGARTHEVPAMRVPEVDGLREAPVQRTLADARTHEVPEPESGGMSPEAPEPSTSASDDARKHSPEPGASGQEGTRLPGMSGVPSGEHGEDVPVGAGAWVAHSGLALLPLGGVWGASRVGGDTRLGATASEVAAGMLLGSQPAKLLFLRPALPSEGRWMELEVAAFGAGLVLTPPLAALGTWGMGELAFGSSQDRGDAYLGALTGAAAGALLGVAVHGLLTKLARPSSRLKTERDLIALGIIGAGATLGYQWARCGPSASGPTR